MKRASEAWSWRHAILRSGLPPTTRHVLLTLSCCMDERGQSCFPSIEEMVELTGLSKRAVISHLAAACDAGWLTKQLHGYRGQRWRRLEYLPAWPGRDIEPEQAGNGDCEGDERRAPRSVEVVNVVHEGGERRAPKVVNVVHRDKEQSKDSSTTSPESERESAGARAAGEPDPEPRHPIRFRPRTDPDPDAGFDRLAGLWRTRDKLAEARALWDEFPEADRTAALAYAPVFLREHKGRIHLEALATWLRGASWRVPEPGDGLVNLDPLTKPWWAHVWRRHARGEPVGFTLSQALAGKPIALKPEDVPAEAEQATLCRILVDSPAYAAWQEHMTRHNARLPAPDRVPVIWCPSPYPPGWIGERQGGAAAER